MQVRGGRAGAGRRAEPKGLEQAFAELVRAHEAAVHGYVHRRVRDAGRAEDITQEVFLRAWRHAERYDADRADPRAWLFAIARNLVIDSYRAEGVRPRTAGTDALLVALPAPDDTEAAVAAWSMADALRLLSVPHRDVLLCLYYRRWTLAQTAEHLGVPVGTVKSRSTYALRALRLIVEEREGS